MTGPNEGGKGDTLTNQTNLGVLRYKYEVCPSKAIPADGADITLIPQLPEGAEDTGRWLWSTGETTRQLTVKADRSYVYRVTYTAQNGRQSQQTFAIAVSGDAPADAMTTEATVLGGSAAETAPAGSAAETAPAGSAAETAPAGSATASADEVTWSDGSHGLTYTISSVGTDTEVSATYNGQTYTLYIYIKAAEYGYYDLQGRRLHTAPTKGIYIVNGRKHVRYSENSGERITATSRIVPGTIY